MSTLGWRSSQELSGEVIQLGQQTLIHRQNNQKLQDQPREQEANLASGETASWEILQAPNTKRRRLENSTRSKVRARMPSERISLITSSRGFSIHTSMTTVMEKMAVGSNESNVEDHYYSCPNLRAAIMPICGMWLPGSWWGLRKMLARRINSDTGTSVSRGRSLTIWKPRPKSNSRSCRRLPVGMWPSCSRTTPQKIKTSSLR